MSSRASEPIGWANPRLTSSTPAMSVEATAPRPTVSTPRRPSAGSTVGGGGGLTTLDTRPWRKSGNSARTRYPGPRVALWLPMGNQSGHGRDRRRTPTINSGRTMEATTNAGGRADALDACPRAGRKHRSTGSPTERATTERQRRRSRRRRLPSNRSLTKRARLTEPAAAAVDLAGRRRGSDLHRLRRDGDHQRVPRDGPGAVGVHAVHRHLRRAVGGPVRGPVERAHPGDAHDRDLQTHPGHRDHDRRDARRRPALPGLDPRRADRRRRRADLGVPARLAFVLPRLARLQPAHGIGSPSAS